MYNHVLIHLVLKYNSNNFKWLSNKVLNLLEKRKEIKNNLSHLISQIKRKRKRKQKGPLTITDIPRRLRKYWKSLKHKINKLDKQIQTKKQSTILESRKIDQQKWSKK